MTGPIRHESHILENKSRKFFQKLVPDEWVVNTPNHDYGIDFQVEIAINNQITGLNFSVQLKSTSVSKNQKNISVPLKRSTIVYYFSRLEPVMLVIYNSDDDEAYWSWIHELAIDLTKSNETFTVSISKEKKLSTINWVSIKGFIQSIFNKRSFLEYINLEILSSTQIAAWKSFYSGSYEQAIFLFKQLQIENDDINITQALSWSYYLTHNYKDALLTVNRLLDNVQNDHILLVKACILTEFGIRTGNKGMILSGKMIFEKFITSDSDPLHLYNYANALGALGHDTSAAKYYHLSLELNPNSAECWKNLGTIYWNLQQHDKELECYANALAINPTLIEALFSKGVTLSKIYDKHQEALELFSIVLKNEELLLKNYPKGYFWVAYAYENNEELLESLKWINKGLDFLPTENSLLNFKSNLLAKNWEQYPILKQDAIDFFSYRIDLDNDPLSIYHYIKIRNFTEQEAFTFLKEKFPFVISLTWGEFQHLGFSIQNLMDSVANINYFIQFKKTYASDRYINHLINPYFSIEIGFWNHFDIISLISFTNLIKSSNEIDGIECCKVYSNAFPILLEIFIPSKTFNKETSIEILAFIMLNFPTIAFREIGAQAGYLGGVMSLGAIDPETYMTKEWEEEFNEKIFIKTSNLLDIELSE